MEIPERYSLVDIPKGFLTQIYIEDGPREGELASPCLCGHPTDPDDPNVALIGWYSTGQLMYVHRDCVRGEDS